VTILEHRPEAASFCLPIKEPRPLLTGATVHGGTPLDSSCLILAAAYAENPPDFAL